MPEAIQAQEKAQFSLGPWHTAGPVIRDDNDHDLALLDLHRPWEPGYGPIPETEWRATAALIAAAPDLYEALLLMIEGKVTESRHAVHPSGRFCKYCGRNSEEYVHSTNCSVLIAELAIAKAEGKLYCYEPCSKDEALADQIGGLRRYWVRLDGMIEKYFERDDGLWPESIEFVRPVESKP